MSAAPTAKSKFRGGWLRTTFGLVAHCARSETSRSYSTWFSTSICRMVDETAAADFYNNRCARVACLEPVLAGLTRSLRADYPRKRRTAFPDTFARDRVDEPTRKPEPHAVTLAGKLTHDRPPAAAKISPQPVD